MVPIGCRPTQIRTLFGMLLLSIALEIRRFRQIYDDMFAGTQSIPLEELYEGKSRWSKSFWQRRKASRCLQSTLRYSGCSFKIGSAAFSIWSISWGKYVSTTAAVAYLMATHMVREGRGAGNPWLWFRCRYPSSRDLDHQIAPFRSSC